LIKRGITKDDRFCILSPHNIRNTVLLLASYFLGATLVPIRLYLSVYEVKKDVENMESIVIFTSIQYTKHSEEIIKEYNESNNKNKKIKSIFVMDGNYKNYITFDELLEEGKNLVLDRTPHFDFDPKNYIFLLLHSSGTTDLPKTLIISHYSFVTSLLEYWNSKQFDNLRVLMAYIDGHIGGLLFLPVWMGSGATVVVLERYEEELWFQSVEKYRINLLFVFPANSYKLIRGELADKYDFSSVKLIYTGGAPFPGNVAEEIVKKYKVIFREHIL
jgi:acyl-coenzyme A synthetase/AMP-(fatty) acid ligase